MRRIAAVISCLLLCLPLIAADAGTPIALTNARILWLGDSITQGGAYVTFVQYYLDKQFPHDKVDIVSIGLASETTSGLTEKAHPFPRPCIFERLGRALEKVKPAVVIACYGMNDGIYHPESPDRMEAFQKGIKKLIDDVHGAGAQIVLLTPPPFDKIGAAHLLPETAPDFSYLTPYSGYDSVIANFAKWEMTLSSDRVEVVDLHSPMNDYLVKIRETNPRFSFTADGIHPNIAGNLLMAEIILHGLGLAIPFNQDLNKELAKDQADPLYTLVQQQRQLRSDGWLPYVGYTRGNTVKADTVMPTEQANAQLQLQIDSIRSN